MGTILQSYSYKIAYSIIDSSHDQIKATFKIVYKAVNWSFY